MRNKFRKQIFEVTEQSFEKLALEIFFYQFSNNDVYREYCKLTGKNVNNVRTLFDIPFLPIEFFKTHRIITGSLSPQKTFISSGTTGQQTSRHEVYDLQLYEESFLKTFELFFGGPNDYCILALLPSYSDRSDSSLVYMVQELMKAGSNPLSGFYLYNYGELSEKLLQLGALKQKTILFGVTFALLDFAEKFQMPLQQTIIIETGGMKGRREEITRAQVHGILTGAFGTKNICSEYGMTELLSQGYSMGEEKFHSPQWMKILIRDVNDPFQIADKNATGAINIIDLANLDSCAFIATSDLGKISDDDSFEVLGRIDQSDVRGCNLLVELL